MRNETVNHNSGENCTFFLMRKQQNMDLDSLLFIHRVAISFLYPKDLSPL